MDTQLRLLPPSDAEPAVSPGRTRSQPPTGAATTPAAAGTSPAPARGWHLDPQARAVGRRGVMRARSALQAARRASHPDTIHAA